MWFWRIMSPVCASLWDIASMTLPGLTSGLGNSIVATSMTVLAADGSSVTPMIFSRIS